MLTDSKVPRNTKALVEGVAKKKHKVCKNIYYKYDALLEVLSFLQEPEVVGKILDAIQNISEEAQRALTDSELPRPSLVSGLSVSLCFLVQIFTQFRSPVTHRGEPRSLGCSRSVPSIARSDPDHNGSITLSPQH